MALMCNLSPPQVKKMNTIFSHMGKAIDTYYQIYDKFLLTRDFKAEYTEPCLSQSLFEYDANALVNEKTCFKSKNNPIHIDLFITNSSNSFSKYINNDNKAV